MANNPYIPRGLYRLAECFLQIRGQAGEHQLSRPVKTALALMNRVGPTFRLPLCEPAEKVRAQLVRTLTSLNLV